MDAVKEDMQVVGVRIEDTENRVKWKTMIHCDDARKGKSRKEKKNNSQTCLQVTPKSKAQVNSTALLPLFHCYRQPLQVFPRYCALTGKSFCLFVLILRSTES